MKEAKSENQQKKMKGEKRDKKYINTQQVTHGM
jgi:hypothetical protein